MVNKNKSLQHFHWTGINHHGVEITGIIHAENKDIAKADLRTQQINVFKISRKIRSVRFFNAIKTHHLALFTRQLVTMIQAGIPLSQALILIIQVEKHVTLRLILQDVHSSIAAGLSLAEVLSKHPDCFNGLFCSLVESGEKSGSLEVLLLQIAQYKEKTESLKKKLKKSLNYPLTILLITLVTTNLLLACVVPQFNTLFANFGAKLPLLTRIVLTLSQFIQSYGVLLFLASIIIFYAAFHFIKRSKLLRDTFDYCLLKIPIIGDIIKKAAIARFSRTLSITFAAGLSLLESLEMTAKVSVQRVFAEASCKMRAEIAMGKQLHTAIANTGLFPDLITQMVAIGEESGTLGSMLAKSADFYEQEVDDTLQAKTSLLEPCLMSLMGLIVGSLVIAMYLPIFTLGQIV